jgi:hypothetical protein
MELRAVVLPPSPQPSPPETGGEGVGRVTGPGNHKDFLLIQHYPLSLDGGEGWGEGEVSFPEQKMLPRIHDLLDDGR